MAMSGKEKMARHRAKVKAKLARLERFEAALKEIATGNSFRAKMEPRSQLIAESALNAEAEA